MRQITGEFECKHRLLLEKMIKSMYIGGEYHTKHQFREFEENRIWKVE
jgi:hypothetical protein